VSGIGVEGCKEKKEINFMRRKKNYVKLILGRPSLFLLFSVSAKSLEEFGKYIQDIEDNRERMVS
jgi:predicted metallo-beta-lactamase superfamily hydrolase